MAEEWKDIEGFPGYRVSNTGMIWSNKLKRVLIPPIDRYGYFRIGLWKNMVVKKVFVHRLVASHFIPNPENKPTVNHKDKNKHNNHFSNLEWHTVAEQNAHRNLTYKGTKGIHTKPIVLEKDGVEYPFNTTMEARKLLGVDNVYWHKLLAGGSIKGYKIKNVAGV